jgi:hypothetical protein
MTGTALLLPLTFENHYLPEVLVCGGSNINDQQPGHSISSQDPASSQCFRMELSEEGISRGWDVEDMPQARTMADAVLLPDGNIVVVNGASSGMAGYGNVHDPAGASNAGNPVLTPILYKPAEKHGQRFVSEGLPTSDIPRMYHSVATLTPAGDIMIAGSNPNLDRSAEKFGTEYRVEWLAPPYFGMERPQIKGHVEKIRFGEAIKLDVALTGREVKTVRGSSHFSTVT